MATIQAALLILSPSLACGVIAAALLWWAMHSRRL